MLKDYFSHFFGYENQGHTLQVLYIGHFMTGWTFWKHPLDGWEHCFYQVWLVPSWASPLLLELYTTLATWGSGFVGTLLAVIPPLPLHNRCFAIITVPCSAGGESARRCAPNNYFHHNGLRLSAGNFPEPNREHHTLK